MEYASGGDMFDFFMRNKAFVNVKVGLGSQYIFIFNNSGAAASV